MRFAQFLQLGFVISGIYVTNIHSQRYTRKGLRMNHDEDGKERFVGCPKGAHVQASKGPGACLVVLHAIDIRHSRAGIQAISNGPTAMSLLPP